MNEPMIRLDERLRRFAAAGVTGPQRKAPTPSPTTPVPARLAPARG